MGALPFGAATIGRLWYGNIEIDAMAVNPTGNKIVFAEVKYSHKVDPSRIRKNWFRRSED